MRTKILITIAAASVAAALLAACGGEQGSSTTANAADTTAAAPAGGSGGGTVRIAADPNALAFQQTDVTAPAGEDTIAFDNPSATGHDVTIEDSSGEDVAETDTVSDGKTSTTADLQPGTYTFYCSVPGHREAGMEGTITVK